MKPEMIEFYADHHIPLEKQVAMRPKGLTPGQIEAAAEFVYRNREGIEPVMLVREVRRIAKEIEVNKYRDPDDVRQAGLAIAGAKGSIEQFKIEVKSFKDEVGKLILFAEEIEKLLEGHLRRVENSTWTNRILVIIIILMLVGVLAGVWINSEVF